MWLRGDGWRRPCCDFRWFRRRSTSLSLSHFARRRARILHRRPTAADADAGLPRGVMSAGLAHRSHHLATRADRLAAELSSTLDELGASVESSKIKKVVRQVVDPISNAATPQPPTQGKNNPRHRQSPRLNQQLRWANRPPWNPCGTNEALAKTQWVSSRPRYDGRAEDVQLQAECRAATDRFMMRLQLTMSARERRASPVPWPVSDINRPWIPTSGTFWYPLVGYLSPLDPWSTASSHSKFAGSPQWVPRPPPRSATPSSSKSTPRGSPCAMYDLEPPAHRSPPRLAAPEAPRQAPQAKRKRRSPRTKKIRAPALAEPSSEHGR